MKIHYPESWSKVPGVADDAPTISINAILPQAGANTSVILPRWVNLRPGAVETFLWQPPYTAINGWSEQPSEIAQSHLIHARVVGISPRPEYPSRSAPQYRHELEIVSTEPLLPALRALARDDHCWALVQIGQMGKGGMTTHHAWDEVHWCGKAMVEGLLYLVANTHHEAHMELIVEQVDGELFGLFNAHSDPGGDACDLGRRKLSGSEQLSVALAIHRAWPLDDTYQPYLTA